MKSIILVTGNKGTCYSAAYVSRLNTISALTVLDVAADWHEAVLPRHIMWPSIAYSSGQLGPWYITTDIILPQLATLGLHPIAHRLLDINNPVGMASWVGVGTQFTTRPQVCHCDDNIYWTWRAWMPCWCRCNAAGQSWCRWKRRQKLCSGTLSIFAVTCVYCPSFGQQRGWAIDNHSSRTGGGSSWGICLSWLLHIHSTTTQSSPDLMSQSHHSYIHWMNECCPHIAI